MTLPVGTEVHDRSKYVCDLLMQQLDKHDVNLGDGLMGGLLFTAVAAAMNGSDVEKTVKLFRDLLIEVSDQWRTRHDEQR